MKAQDFLRQIKRLDLMIQNKIAEKDRWTQMAFGTSSPMTGERVQTTRNLSKMADSVCRYMDLEKEIDACIDSLVDTRNNVIELIEQLNPIEYDVLHKRYVQYMAFVEIADTHNKTKSWATTIHGRALRNVQKLLDEREQNG